MTGAAQYEQPTVTPAMFSATFNRFWQAGHWKRITSDMMLLGGAQNRRNHSYIETDQAHD